MKWLNLELQWFSIGLRWAFPTLKKDCNVHADLILGFAFDALIVKKTSCNLNCASLTLLNVTLRAGPKNYTMVLSDRMTIYCVCHTCLLLSTIATLLYCIWMQCGHPLLCAKHDTAMMELLQNSQSWQCVTPIR